MCIRDRGRIGTGGRGRRRTRAGTTVAGRTAPPSEPPGERRAGGAGRVAVDVGGAGRATAAGLAERGGPEHRHHAGRAADRGGTGRLRRAGAGRRRRGGPPRVGAALPGRRPGHGRGGLPAQGHGGVGGRGTEPGARSRGRTVGAHRRPAGAAVSHHPQTGAGLPDDAGGLRRDRPLARGVGHHAPRGRPLLPGGAADRPRGAAGARRLRPGRPPGAVQPDRRGAGHGAGVQGRRPHRQRPALRARARPRGHPAAGAAPPVQPRHPGA